MSITVIHVPLLTTVGTLLSKLQYATRCSSMHTHSFQCMKYICSTLNPFLFSFLPILSLLPFSSLCSFFPLYLFCLFPTSLLLLLSLFPYLTVSLVVHPDPISKFSSNSWSMQGMKRLRRSVARICRAAISSSLRRWATSWGQLWNRANIPCTMLDANWFTCREDGERGCLAVVCKRILHAKAGIKNSNL